MKRANSGRNPADRISALPDSILSLILSFIPTDNAVATSVLSKRWISLWKSVHNLDFNLDFGRYHYHLRSDTEWSADKEMKFSCFVNNVLLLHDGGFMNKFSLVWKWNPLCIPSNTISWINTAITRNLHELYLYIYESDYPFEIPSSVFCCLTLKSLELDGKMFVSDSAAVYVCLPKLERLKLVSVSFQSDVAFQKLISACPVLNFLFVEMYMEKLYEYIMNTETNLFTFKISSTSLRHFFLDVESEDELPNCSLELEATSLVYLSLVGYVRRIVVRKSLSSLVEAHFSLTLCKYELSDANICNSLVEAIRACNCAKSLTLSAYVLAALNCATIGLSTKFKRLTELETRATCCSCSSLQDFIQSSDSLEVLIVNEDSRCLVHENDNYIHMHSNWTAPVEIPRCLSNSLKTVEFDAYRGFGFERDMIRYILRHGSALEVMKINCYIKRHGVKLELVDEIRDFPRKSRACRVNFFSDVGISFGLQG